MGEPAFNQQVEKEHLQDQNTLLVLALNNKLHCLLAWWLGGQLNLPSGMLM